MKTTKKPYGRKLAKILEKDPSIICKYLKNLKESGFIKVVKERYVYANVVFYKITPSGERYLKGVDKVDN